MEMDALLALLGCNSIESTKARFLGEVDFYRDITTEALNDPGFETLGAQLTARDTKAAFDTAHMLKGVVSNCGLNTLFNCIVDLVEPLRTGAPDYDAMKVNYQRMLDQRDADKKILAENA